MQAYYGDKLGYNKLKIAVLCGCCSWCNMLVFHHRVHDAIKIVLINGLFSELARVYSACFGSSSILLNNFPH